MREKGRSHSHSTRILCTVREPQFFRPQQSNGKRFQTDPIATKFSASCIDANVRVLSSKPLHEFSMPSARRNHPRRPSSTKKVKVSDHTPQSSTRSHDCPYN